MFDGLVLQAKKPVSKSFYWQELNIFNERKETKDFLVLWILLYPLLGMKTRERSMLRFGAASSDAS